jgi:hypothetical protein
MVVVVVVVVVVVHGGRGFCIYSWYIDVCSLLLARAQ